MVMGWGPGAPTDPDVLAKFVTHRSWFPTPPNCGVCRYFSLGHHGSTGSPFKFILEQVAPLGAGPIALSSLSPSLALPRTGTSQTSNEHSFHGQISDHLERTPVFFSPELPTAQKPSPALWSGGRGQPVHSRSSPDSDLSLCSLFCADLTAHHARTSSKHILDFSIPSPTKPLGCFLPNARDLPLFQAWLKCHLLLEASLHPIKNSPFPTEALQLHSPLNLPRVPGS